MLQISALEKLVHELSQLPGIGPKTAQRLAYYILRTQDNFSDRLGEALARVKAEVHVCPKCFNYTDKDLCKYCEDIHRSNEVLCVVEEPSDIVRIESSGAFRGRYHVLHGAISPLEGISPKDLKIQELIDRVNSSLQQNDESQMQSDDTLSQSNDAPTQIITPIKEIILALDADLEGDTTVLYIAKQLHGKNIKISRIAHGVPIGSDIDFIDDRTMGRALENRVEI